MSSSGGKSFTAIIVLALFGIGGALVDTVRHNEDEQITVEPLPVAPLKEFVVPKKVEQKPDFIAANLANDGTGIVAGNALPGSRITLDLDGKAIKAGEASESGDFFLEIDKPLELGKHVLKLQSVEKTGSSPIHSDQQIKLNIRKGQNIIVTVLEKGQPPQVLQGVEDKLQDSGIADRGIADRGTSKKLDKAPEAEATATGNKTVEMTPSNPFGLASRVSSRTDKVATKPATSKREWRNISFTETKYIDGDGKIGQVKLSGLAQAGANLRVILNGKKLGNTVADKSGAWSLSASKQLSPGAHWMLVEQLDDKGERISYVEAPFDRGVPPLKKTSEKAPAKTGNLSDGSRADISDKAQTKKAQTKREGTDKEGTDKEGR